MTILILFIYSKTGSAAIIEEKYSKQIALIIDSSKPGMEIHLNMEDAIKEAEDNGWDLDKVVTISGNSVIIKLREKGENSYDFFNDLEVSSNLDTSNNKEYFFIIGNYN